jgi:hypothetical protein
MPLPNRVSPPETFRPQPDQAEHPKEVTVTPTQVETAERTVREISKICNEEFTKCLDSAAQSKRGPLFKHSHCHSCRDVCVRQKGTWPDAVDKVPCH